MSGSASKRSSGLDFSKALVPLLLLTGMFFLNFFCRILISPLLPEMKQAFDMTNGQAGGLFLFLSAGYVIALTSSGVVSSVLSHRTTILMCSVLVCFSLFGVAACEQLWQLRLAITVLGLSAGCYIPSSISTITSLVRAEHWGRAIAVHELAPNAAFILAPLAVGGLSHYFSWRETVVATGLLTLAMGVVFLCFGRGGRFRGEKPNFRILISFLASGRFWLVAGLFSLGVSGTLGIFSMLPLYLVSYHDFDPDLANSLVGYSRVLTLVAALVSGWLADQLGPKRTITWVMAITGLLTVLLGVLSGIPLLVMMFIQPLTAVCFFAAGFVAISKISSEANRSMAVSVVIPVGFLIGGGAVPQVIGMLGQHGMFHVGIAATGVLIGMGTFLAKLLKLPE